MYLAKSADGQGRFQIGCDLANFSTQVDIAADASVLAYNPVSNGTSHVCVDGVRTIDPLMYEQPPNGSYSHLLVYTKSALAEQSTPVAFNLSDSDASVSNISFPDLDLDQGHLGGNLTWLEPADTSQVQDYAMYLAADEVGAARAYVGNLSNPHLDENGTWHAQQTGPEHLVFAVPNDTNLSVFSHLLIYTRSSFVEQTTPVAHLVHDVDASVSDIGFAGRDLNIEDAFGNITWAAPEAAEAVDAYVAYLALNASGDGRSHLGTVPAGTTFYEPAEGTDARDFEHFAVYTRPAPVAMW